MPGESRRFAEEDIICYKVVKRHLHSKELKGCFQSNYVYSFNKVMEIKKHLVVKGIKTGEYIDEGFHSYAEKFKINHHLHTKKTGYRCRKDTALWIIIPVKCVIPKGSFYFINKQNNEYVSDTIIIKEILYKD